MANYTVRFFTGDYRDRQQAANQADAVLYFEGHANSADSSTADYSMCICSTNASNTSIALGRKLAQAWGPAVDVGGDTDTDIGNGTGVRIGGRGDGNLRHTSMPAVLGEPVFCSNPIQARWAETDAGIKVVAGILANSIRETFPNGGLVAFSIGHKGKVSQPRDMGARWMGDRFGTEAEYVEAYLHVASDTLAADGSIGGSSDLVHATMHVNLRTRPDWSAFAHGDIRPQTALGVLDRYNGWTYVCDPSDNKCGWIADTHLTA
jgi:hypothetical protein